MVNDQWSMINTPTATLPPAAAPHSYQSPASDFAFVLESWNLNPETFRALPENSHATSTPHSPESAQRAVDRTPGFP